MSTIPDSKNTIQALIDAHHESLAEPPRPHMGASQLGHPCDRWLWLSFRWAVQPDFAGRILRVFRRGQNEEAAIVSDLRAIGMDVRNTTGRHAERVDFGAHVSGSLDGIIESGVPGALKVRHVSEFKTHALRSFEDVVNNGVEKSKTEHFVQMQLYMHGTGVGWALYVAVCKNDDRIYTERVEYAQGVAEKYLERGQRIALSDRMPPPVSTDPGWYQCRFCDAHEFCFETKLTEHVNCRTCAHSTALDNSTWRCERFGADDIPVEFQRTGCDSHVLHPDLVPWQRQDGRDEWTAVYIIGGQEVANGEPREDVYGSRELLANADLCAQPDEAIERLRKKFGARIVG